VNINGRLRAGIVSVRITGQDWNWRAPWEKQAPWTRTVTGLVVPGRRILVASTALGNEILVEAQKLGSDARTPGRVALVDQEGPLALVEVDDTAFWDGLDPLPLAERAPTEGPVSLYRWQRSGLLDAYPGSVRQVRAGRHGFSQTALLTLDIAAATDSLGESEVVMADGRVAGLVTGRAGDAYTAIASPVLRQFLEGSAGGQWPGFPRAGIAWQDLTNPALHELLGLGPDEGGIRLTRVLPYGSAGGVLQPGDVLLELDGARLDPTGYYEHPLYGRMLFALLFSDGRRPGERLDAKVLRDGQRLEVALPLVRMQPEKDKVPPYVFGRGPDYVIAGGLVFQELTKPYLSAWGDWTRSAPPRLLVALDREGREPTPEAPRLVLLATVLPDAANLGYEGLHDLIVARVNGRPIGSLDDLRAALATPERGFHVIEFVPGQGEQRIVLDVQEAQASVARLHGAYGVERMDSSAPEPSASGRAGNGAIESSGEVRP
jgi:S1-C subfamily serine protease